MRTTTVYTWLAFYTLGGSPRRIRTASTTEPSYTLVANTDLAPNRCKCNAMLLKSKMALQFDCLPSLFQLVITPLGINGSWAATPAPVHKSLSFYLITQHQTTDS